MAALDLQEQEQIEELKGWWKENGNQVLGALLMVAVVLGGWRGWQYYQHEQSSRSAMLYTEFVKQLDSNDAGRINDAAAAMLEKFSSSAYAPRAALMAAFVNEQSNDVVRATTQLQWVIDHADETELRDVARLRLGALLLDEGKYSEVMSLLSSEHSSAFDGLYADLRGDVFNAQGKAEEARSAYKLAYEKTDANSMYRNLIQMKLDALVIKK